MNECLKFSLLEHDHLPFEQKCIHLTQRQTAISTLCAVIQKQLPLTCSSHRSTLPTFPEKRILVQYCEDFLCFQERKHSDPSNRSPKGQVKALGTSALFTASTREQRRTSFSVLISATSRHTHTPLRSAECYMSVSA